MKKAIIILICIVTAFSCSRPENIAEMNANDRRFEFRNGVLYFNHELYSGVVEEKFPGGIRAKLARYAKGKENGFTETFYENGEKESARMYTNGEKDSIATGWWPGGKMKFEYHFNKGNYDGAFREWYMTGAVAREIMYANGKELSGKEWRENGKIYTNFIWKGDRRYGVVNANMCYGVEKGKVAD